MADNVAILRDLYGQWHETRGGSVDSWLGAMVPEVEMGSVADGAPGIAFTATRRGVDDAREYFTGLRHTLEMVSFQVTEFIAQGDRVVALIESEWKDKQTGKVLHLKKCDVLRLKDGKIVSFFDYFDTAAFQALAAGK